MIMSRELPLRLKTFISEHQLGVNRQKATVKDISEMVKLMPQYQKELKQFSINLSMAEKCMKHYTERVQLLCTTEQVSVRLG